MQNGSSDVPYPSARHRRHFSRDDQDDEVAHAEHLDVHDARRPVVRGMGISLEQAGKHGKRNEKLLPQIFGLVRTVFKRIGFGD
jgi:hypothetical protein